MHYHIVPLDPKAHLFHVTLTLDNAQKAQEFSLPAWLPGSYMIRDFARNIIDISALDENNQVIALTQLDKQRWRAANTSPKLTLSYQVYAWDLSVRSAHLDMSHGFFNGSSVFLSVTGTEDNPSTVTIAKPQDALLQHWQLATSLKRMSGDEFGFGDFSAENYQDLIDHPVEMGELIIGQFDACGVHHDVVLSGASRVNMARLCQDLKTICEYQINLFGGQAPFERYVFMTRVLDNGFGGLEHKASTALMCSRKDLPQSLDAKVNKDYRTYLSLCSHEYFHSWNVKRILPKEFIPFDLSQESYTNQLWAYEGITSYFDDFITYRAGCIDASSYLELLSATMTRVYRGQGRFKQSLKASSFNAWTKFYKQDENAANAIVSYYTKGALFALMLDLTLRIESKGKYSLDNLMQQLWQHHGLTGVGTDENSHKAIIEQLLGRNCDELFSYLDNTEDLPLEALLAKVGIEMTLRASEGGNDLGDSLNDGKPRGYKIGFGAKFKAEASGLTIISVTQGSPAHDAGLSAGDVLISCDALKVTAEFERQLQDHQLGERLTLHWFRRDVLMQGQLTLQAPMLDTVALRISDPDAAKIWLSY
ncbi:peptidase M61 [Shewanella denitrificans OS217]|uniref:Peptidase M61 n=1 Tax=Shewanella denitrificans (strain OS217 / ATCC BAA-1090 / DSM 15013) TaxID=318161 RepID=Q12LS0_SHEDO|nr:PDZ domain-containing protein [Shewanella denitrificans]ABE55606.1 peptidase M61 [Shewanella denitrificans OS217]